MRHLSFLATAAALLLTACTSDDLTPADGFTNDGDGNVQITLRAPEALATRATTPTLGATSNSALGGITNCNMAKKYDFRYQFAIYDEQGNTQYYYDKRTSDDYQSQVYDLRLSPGHTYTFVVWADFVKQGKKVDLHYNTADLANITCLDDADHQLNDESRDAYFITQKIVVDGSGKLYDPADTKSNKTAITELVLRRPFAKVRVVTTDYQQVQNFPLPDYFKITYKNCKRFSGMNAVSGQATGADIQAGSEVVYTSPRFASKTRKDYALVLDGPANQRTLTVDYLMVNTDEEPIHFLFQAYDSKGTDDTSDDYEVVSKDIQTNIPTKRNWLTTLFGNFLTTHFQMQVRCDEYFYDEWMDEEPWWAPDVFPAREPQKEGNTYVINDENEFVWLSQAERGNINVKLNADLDFNGTLLVPISTNVGGNFHFDGQGHTIKNARINFAKTVQKLLLGFIPTTVPAEGAGVFGWMFQGSEIKNTTFKNIIINGLYGSKGHEKEYCKSAGCIGWIRGNVENCHAEDIEINGEANLLSQNNVGGLIGYYNLGVANPHVSDCSATNILIHSDAQAGGLIGSIGDESTDDDHNIGMNITNCHADGVWIHNSYEGVTNSTGDNTVLSGGLAALVGGVVHGTGLTLTNCTATTAFNVFGPNAAQNTAYMNAMTDASAYPYQQKFLIGVCCHGADAVMLK